MQSPLELFLSQLIQKLDASVVSITEVKDDMPYVLRIGFKITCLDCDHVEKIVYDNAAINFSHIKELDENPHCVKCESTHVKVYRKEYDKFLTSEEIEIARKESKKEARRKAKKGSSEDTSEEAEQGDSRTGALRKNGKTSEQRIITPSVDTFHRHVSQERDFLRRTGILSDADVRGVSPAALVLAFRKKKVG